MFIERHEFAQFEEALKRAQVLLFRRNNDCYVA